MNQVCAAANFFVSVQFDGFHRPRKKQRRSDSGPAAEA